MASDRNLAISLLKKWAHERPFIELVFKSFEGNTFLNVLCFAHGLEGNALELVLAEDRFVSVRLDLSEALLRAGDSRESSAELKEQIRAQYDWYVLISLPSRGYCLLAEVKE